MEATSQAQEHPIPLEDAKEQFEYWRATRPKGRSRIPGELWQRAIELVGSHTVDEVARSLSLNHSELKSRYEAQHSPAAPPAVAVPPRFVEFSCQSPSIPVAGCVLEVEGSGGRKLKVTVQYEGSGLDVLALARGLWDVTA
jgi:hypothetical protein